MTPSSLLHLAYDLHISEPDWMRRLGTAYRQMMPELKESFAFCYQANSVGAPMTLPCGYQAESVSPERFYGVLAQLTQKSSWPVMTELYRQPQCARLSERLKAIGFDHIMEGVRKYGVEDVRAFASGMPNGEGFLFASFNPDAWYGAARKQRLWSTITAHVSQAMGLRHTLQGEAQRADWIFDPAHGTHLHATAHAQTRDARQSLEHMAQGLDALQLDRSLNEQERVEKWAELVQGEWTLVQTHEHCGRRLILAIRNTPKAKLAISPMQAKILRLMLKGHSITFIAYELERAYSTILAQIGRLREHFMVSNNAELMEVAHTWLSKVGVPAPVSGLDAELCAIDPSLDHPDLSPAECELVELLRKGYTENQIAGARHVQAKTVQNQLHMLYIRFEVHSRTELLLALRTQAKGSALSA